MEVSKTNSIKIGWTLIELSNISNIFARKKVSLKAKRGFSIYFAKTYFGRINWDRSDEITNSTQRTYHLLADT